MNANEHGFVLAKFQPPKGERVVECENGEFILHCDHIQITKRLEENNLELASQVSALQASQDNIINGLGIKGDGPYSKLVLEKFILLAGEVDAYRALVDNLGVIHSLKAPETDHLLAYYKAQGAEKMFNLVEPAVRNFCNPAVTELVIEELESLAANLRAGRKG